MKHWLSIIFLAITVGTTGIDFTVPISTNSVSLDQQIHNLKANATANVQDEIDLILKYLGMQKTN